MGDEETKPKVKKNYASNIILIVVICIMMLIIHNTHQEVNRLGDKLEVVAIENAEYSDILNEYNWLADNVKSLDVMVEFLCRLQGGTIFKTAEDYVRDQYDRTIEEFQSKYQAFDDINKEQPEEEDTGDLIKKTISSIFD